MDLPYHWLHRTPDCFFFVFCFVLLNLSWLFGSPKHEGSESSKSLRGERNIHQNNLSNIRNCNWATYSQFMVAKRPLAERSVVVEQMYSCNLLQKQLEYLFQYVFYHEVRKPQICKCSPHRLCWVPEK